MLLVLVFGVSASFASDADDSVQATDESAETVSVTNTQNTTLTDSRSDELPDNLGATNEESYGSSNNDVLTANPDGSFTDLANLVKNGGTVTLDRNYVYTESKDSSYIYGVNITKPITIDGRNFKLDGNHLARIFYINSNDVTLKNINFVNGYLENGNMAYHPNYKSYVPSMVEVWGDNLKIDNCVFKDSNVSSSSNAAGALGGDGANALITNSKFYNNYARVGSALTWGHSDQPDVGKNARVVNCIFENNTCFVGYGAINNHANAFTIENCIFKNNTAKNGPAGAVRYYSAGADCKIINSKFINNKASGNGGALTAEGTNCLIENCEFGNNNASVGGAIYWNGANGILNNSYFENNYGSSVGGAIQWHSSYGTIINSNFTKNHANKDEDTVGSGGGAIDVRDCNHVTISKCNFLKNYMPDTYNHWGGAIWFAQAPYCYLEDSYFEDNTAACAGAVYWNAASGYGILTNCEFVGNNATFYYGTVKRAGGAIQWDGPYAQILNSYFYNNNALVASGGAIWLDQVGTVDNCTFVNSSANETGGAIFINNKNYVTITNCDFINSSANSNGGAIYCPASYNTISDCSFVNSESGAKGGALYLGSNYNTVTDSTFTNNRASNQTSNAIYVVENANVCLDGNAYSAGDTVSKINASELSMTLYIAPTAKGKKDGSDANNAANWTYAYSHIANGGTIYFTQGTYTDIVNQAISKTLNLIGLGAVTINLQEKGRAFIISSPHTKIDNIDIINGKMAGNGGAIYWTGAYGTLSNSKLENNYITANYHGGALWWEANYCNIDNVEFINNYVLGTDSNLGGAIHYKGSYFNITNSKFIGNHATAGGTVDCGAFDFYSGGTNGVNYGHIKNCLFENNEAYQYCGAGAVNGQYIVFEDCNFTNNKCYKGTGGALYIAGSNNQLINCRFTNNSADSSAGGAVYIASGATKVENSTFTNNSANTNGGAIWSNSPSLEIVNSEFIDNNANTGAGIFAQGSSTTIENSTFSGNNASQGSGVYINSGVSIQVSNSTFENNDGNGTVYLGNNAKATLDNNEFESNTGGTITTVGEITSDLFFIRPGATGTGLIETNPTNWTYAINHINNGGKIIFLPGTYSDLIKRLLFQFSEMIL